MREAGNQQLGSVGDRLDAQGFAALFEQSWPTLWTIGVAVLGRRDEVEDVLQDSAMIALGKLEDFDPTTSFTAWMGQIVRYTALNAGRRSHRRSSLTAGSNGMLEHTTAKQGSAARHWDGSDAGALRPDQLGFDDRLGGCLMQLSQVQRTCLLLRIVNGNSYKDISRTMDLPQGTAMSHVHRAQRMLRTLMSESNEETGKGDRVNE